MTLQSVDDDSIAPVATTTNSPQARDFEHSHAFIDFSLDLSKPLPELWLNLGELVSKIDHVRGALLKPTTARDLQRLYMIKGALATTAIEGNTLTEEQADGVINGELRLPPSQAYLGREIQNVVDSCNEMIAATILPGPPPALSVNDICRYDAEILANLDEVLEDGVEPGVLRHHSVVVGTYRAPPAQDVEYLLARMCDWLNGPDFVSSDERWKGPLSIIRAIIAHLYVAWIHPFGDGNGRTARMVEFRLLMEAGVPLPAATLLSNHYNQTRSAYYASLAASSRQGPLVFLSYAVQGFLDGVRSQLDVIRNEQFNDRWEQYVYETFGPNTSPTAVRQRRLVLAVSRAPGPVVRGELRRLTPELAEAYATKTGKTLSRDINQLIAMGLIQRTAHGFVSRKETLEAFKPAAAPV
jgi:Fic family protein